MAGEKVYTGAMISALETKIDTMTGKLDTMITDLAAHTTKLGEISSGVSQGVSTLNVKSGITGKTVVLKGSIAEIVMSTMSTNYSIGVGFKARCNGVVKFNCVAYCESTNTVNIGYDINGGTVVFPLGSAFSLGTSHTAKTFDIPVNAGDNVRIMVVCTSSGGKKILFEAGCNVSYDLLDIVLEGAVVLSGL